MVIEAWIVAMLSGVAASVPEQVLLSLPASRSSDSHVSPSEHRG